jgi:alkaline phosphatase D
MISRIARRDFLRITVVSALAGCTPNLACSSDDDPSDAPEDTLRVFPQGVASGDPQPSSIILWTRVEPKPAETGDITVQYEVATDMAMKSVLVRGELKATADADYTVRLKVTDLQPFKHYYYRFTARKTRSEVGRTKTAPAPDQDVPVRFAFASCQDFVGRFYYAWKALVDENLPPDFVIFLGDYVYESDGDPDFQTPGQNRAIVLPDGMVVDSHKVAKTLADYRSLYKQFRSDADLRRAHQLFPFITIWDDHEFGNDCWQDHTTHFDDKNGDEKNSEQRVAASRAWFEYQPMDVEYTAGATYPNDIKIYRNLRYGKHVELFLTDQRYYRSDHVIPEGPADISILKPFPNSDFGARIFVFKDNLDVKEAAAKPTMLGAEQKQWLINGLKQSNATWKIWGSETQLSQMLADLRNETVDAALRRRFYLTADQWDGYRSERAEILAAVADVQNLVVVVGDIHAFYASELHVDFDNPGAKPVGVEYVVAGISSQAIAPGAKAVLSGDPTLKQLGLAELIDRFDELLKQGCPHYKYAKSFYNGIALCDVSTAAVEVTFLRINHEDVTKPGIEPIFEKDRLRTASGTNKVELV